MLNEETVVSEEVEVESAAEEVETTATDAPSEEVVAE